MSYLAQPGGGDDNRILCKVMIAGETMQGLSWKTHAFPSHCTVGQAIEMIAQKFKRDVSLAVKTHHLVLLPERGDDLGDEISMDPTRPLEDYNLKPESKLEYKKKPIIEDVGGSTKINVRVLDTTDHKEEVYMFALNMTAGQALVEICLRKKYKKPHEYYLSRGVMQSGNDDDLGKLNPLHTLQDQNISAGTLLHVKQRSKEDLKKAKERVQQNVRMYRQQSKIHHQSFDEPENADPSQSSFIIDHTIQDGRQKSGSTSSGGSSSKKSKPSERQLKAFQAQTRRQNIRLERVVPVIVEELLYQIEHRGGFDSEGIFRVSAKLEEVHALSKLYSCGIVGRPTVQELTSFNPHVWACVLKKWLRELPDPLLTFDLYESFLAACRIDENDMRNSCYKRAISSLPPGNRMIAIKMFGCLSRLLAFHKTTLMNAENLGIVFAPVLLKAKGDDIQKMLVDSTDTRRVVSHLIVGFADLFEAHLPANTLTSSSAASAPPVSTQTPATPVAVSAPPASAASAGSAGSAGTSAPTSTLAPPVNKALAAVAGEQQGRPKSNTSDFDKALQRGLSKLNLKMARQQAMAEDRNKRLSAQIAAAAANSATNPTSGSSASGSQGSSAPNSPSSASRGSQIWASATPSNTNPNSPPAGGRVRGSFLRIPSTVALPTPAAGPGPAGSAASEPQGSKGLSASANVVLPPSSPVVSGGTHAGSAGAIPEHMLRHSSVSTGGGVRLARSPSGGSEQNVYMVSQETGAVKILSGADAPRRRSSSEDASVSDSARMRKLSVGSEGASSEPSDGEELTEEALGDFMVIPVEDLVSSLMVEGDLLGVEEYLARLPDEIRKVAADLCTKNFLTRVKLLEEQQRSQSVDNIAAAAAAATLQNTVKLTQSGTPDLGLGALRSSSTSASSSSPSMNRRPSVASLGEVVDGSGGFATLLSSSSGQSTAGAQALKDLSECGVSVLATHALLYCRVVENQDAVQLYLLKKLADQAARQKVTQALNVLYQKLADIAQVTKLNKSNGGAPDDDDDFEDDFDDYYEEDMQDDAASEFLARGESRGLRGRRTSSSAKKSAPQAAAAVEATTPGSGSGSQGGAAAAQSSPQKAAAPKTALDLLRMKKP